MKPRIAATLLVSGSLGLAAFGMGLGSSHATGRPYCPGDPPNWAPGGPPDTSFVHWDWNVCHNYHYGPTGVVDEDSGMTWLYPDGPIAPAAPQTPWTPPPECFPISIPFFSPAECGGL